MTKEEVLAAFELDAQKEDPKQSELTTEDIKKTAKRLIVTDRSAVIEALRDWLNLREGGNPVVALVIIADIKDIPELKPDIEHLGADIESGKAFHPSYIFWVDLALKAINGKP